LRVEGLESRVQNLRLQPSAATAVMEAEVVLASSHRLGFRPLH